MAVKKHESSDKLLWKIMSSNYYIEWKTLIEAICTNNIHSGKSFFAAVSFEGLWVFSFQRERERERERERVKTFTL